MLILKQLLHFRIAISLKPGQSQKPFSPEIQWAVLGTPVHNRQFLGIETRNLLLS